MNNKDFKIDEELTLDKIKECMQVKEIVEFGEAVQNSMDNKHSRFIAELEKNGINKSTSE